MYMHECMCVHVCVFLRSLQKPLSRVRNSPKYRIYSFSKCDYFLHYLCQIALITYIWKNIPGRFCLGHKFLIMLYGKYSSN